MVCVLSLSKDVYQEVQLRKGGLMAVGFRLPVHSRGQAWLRASHYHLISALLSEGEKGQFPLSLDEPARLGTEGSPKVTGDSWNQGGHVACVT